MPPEPSGFELAARAVLNSSLLPLQDGGVIQRALANPEVAVRQATEALRGAVRMAKALPPAARSSLSGPIGRQRRYTWARASLDDVKMIKNNLGGTVNDVFLAAISSGFRALLLARGEEPTPSMIPSLVPVSLRSEGEESIYENRVSALVANLPVDIADPVERLAAIRTQMAALKASNESKAGEAIVDPSAVHAVRPGIDVRPARIQPSAARDRHGHHERPRARSSHSTGLAADW